MSFTTDAAPLIAQLRETWQAGETPEATHDGVTVTITGFSRINDSWPQPLSKITITYKGREATLSGWGCDSWDEAEEAMGSAIDELMMDDALERLPALAHRMRQAQAALDAAEKQVRETVWQAYKYGSSKDITKYQIAKAGGLQERTVGRWCNRPINL